MLGSVRPGLDQGSAQLLDHFAAAKGRLDAAGEQADLVRVCVCVHWEGALGGCGGLGRGGGGGGGGGGDVGVWACVCLQCPAISRLLFCPLPPLCRPPPPQHTNTAPAPTTHHPPPPLQNAVMEVLHAATTVRAVLVAGLASGLRNDAPDSALAMRQK